MLIINITQEEFCLIRESLSELPAKRSMNLILKIDGQVASQLNKKEQSGVENAKSSTN